MAELFAMRMAHPTLENILNLLALGSVSIETCMVSTDNLIYGCPWFQSIRKDLYCYLSIYTFKSETGQELNFSF